MRWFVDPAVNSILRQLGLLIHASSMSPVALRPVLADGLPFREANLSKASVM
jgi:hypothetical protein